MDLLTFFVRLTDLANRICELLRSALDDGRVRTPYALLIGSFESTRSSCYLLITVGVGMRDFDFEVSKTGA
jgi:hypothetical protein